MKYENLHFQNTKLDNESYINILRLLAFLASFDIEIQNKIGNSEIINHTILICENNENDIAKIISASLRLTLNIITKNGINQEKYTYRILSNSNLFNKIPQNSLNLPLIILYNTITSNESKILLLSDPLIIRWYKQIFDYIQKAQKSGITPENEKIYSDYYEWFTLLTLKTLKIENCGAKILGNIFNYFTENEVDIYEEGIIKIIRNIGENHSVIQMSLLQNRFLQYICSEITQQIKETKGEILNEINKECIEFICKLLSVLSAVFISSYDLTKVYKDAFLSMNFTQDIQNLILLLSVFLLNKLI